MLAEAFDPLNRGRRTTICCTYQKVAQARPRAARAFEILRLHKVVRTGDGAALPFSFSSNYEINFADTLLAEGFGHLEPSA